MKKTLQGPGRASLYDLCLCGHIRKVHDGKGACDVPKTRPRPCACKRFRDKLTHVSLLLASGGVSERSERRRGDAVPPARARKARPVTAYECSRCKSLYPEPERADACCRCNVCQTKTTGVSHHFSDRCGYCERERTIRLAKGKVQEVRRELKEAEGWLRKAKAKKRPEKGTPCR